MEGNKKYRKWLEKVAEYKCTMEMPPEKCVSGELWLWKNKYKKEHNRAPTREEKATRQQALLAQLPENNKLQEQIFCKVTFKAKTVDELKEGLKGLTKEQLLSEVHI